MYKKLFGMFNLNDRQRNNTENAPQEYRRREIFMPLFGLNIMKTNRIVTLSMS